MISFRYDTTGSWYKGNTHIHSTASDGTRSFSELADMYAGKGYDFLFRTDHWVASASRADKTEYPLLWLDGIELDGCDATGAQFHVLGLGEFTGMDRTESLERSMERVREQNGLLILAHPFWMGNSFQDALRWNFDGVEIYNHVCRWMNGKSESLSHWHAMLGKAPGTLAFACDDAHLLPAHPGWNGGWIMVNSRSLERDAIFSSIRSGNFYSTLGPLIESIEWNREQTVTIRTSPVQFMRLVGPGWCGRALGSFDGRMMTEASFDIPADWPYAYIDIEDAQGRRAWTNTLLRQD